MPLHFGPRRSAGDDTDHEAPQRGEEPPGISIDSKKDLEEERRLFFVGMTRARRRLILSHARERHWLGQVRPRRPSPFLRNIDAQLYDESRAPVTVRPAASRQLDLF